jgi:hypothetical protein
MDEEQVFEKVHSPSFGLYYTCIQPVAHVAYKAIPLVTTCSSSNSLTRMCVHLVRHYWEANFEAFAPQHTRWTTSVPWTHSGGHLCSSNHRVDHIRYFHGIHWRIYMMVTRVLMSTWNHAFTTIMREVIKLHAHYHESRILSIRMDNDAEFSSCGLNDLHGLEDWSSALYPICPYSKWFV